MTKRGARPQLLRAAALLGSVWIGFAGKLFSFNLNY
nr:hypothetical protein Hi04_10k_c4606_00006 [uncultured bacterium]